MADVTIAEMLRRFKTVNIEQMTGEAMDKNREKIADLNREQLEEGYNANGEFISPKYTSFTVNEKLKKGQRFDVVTLKDTGAFHRSIELNMKGNSFQLFSKDIKSADLQDKYGSKILGLSPSSKKEAWVIVKPDVVQEIKNKTGAI